MQLTHYGRGGPCRPTVRRGERGVVLVLAALAMVTMLVIAALVVDIGGLYAARRQDQNSADAAALAAVQDISDRTSARKSAIDYAEDDLGVDLSDSAWNSCTTDAGALAVRAPGFNCVSFNSSNSRIRVRIPTQNYQAAFAGIIGKQQLPHNAFAVAGIFQRGFGGVLPFGMPSGAGAGDGYACIKSNSGGQSEAPCDGPDSGNFGTVDLGQFGNEDLGTGLDCGSGGSRTARIPNNIAVGSDHMLGMWSPGGSELIDAPDACTAQASSPNAAMTETGNLSGPVEDGFIGGGPGSFSDRGPARLRRLDPKLFNGASQTRTVRGYPGIDNNGLWSFIPADLSGDVPDSCHRDQFVDSAGNPTTANLPARVRVHVQAMSLQDRMLSLLRRCFAHYGGSSWTGNGVAGAPAISPPESRTGCTEPAGSPCTGPVFSMDSTPAENPNLYDIQYTPRFAYVPEMAEAKFPNGSSQPVHFKRFRAVFIQRLVLGTGNNATAFDPGISNAPLSVSGNGIREVTLFVFPSSMLPNGLGTSNAPNEFGKNRFGGLVR